MSPCSVFHSRRLICMADAPALDRATIVVGRFRPRHAPKPQWRAPYARRTSGRRQALLSRLERAEPLETSMEWKRTAEVARQRRLLRTRRRAELQLRCHATTDRQLDVRRDNERHRRIGRQLGRRRDRLRLDNRLSRERRGLQYGSALTVANAVLRVEDHRLTYAARRGQSARHGESRCQRGGHGDSQKGFQRADSMHGRTGADLSCRIMRKTLYLTAALVIRLEDIRRE
jgi:hypothetical protein